MSSLQQQQHQQVTRKRSSEPEGNGGPEERKMAKKEHEAEEDLADGANMSIQVQVTRVSAHNHVHSWTQEDQSYCIQSVLRRDLRISLGEAGGNLLKAGSNRTLETIDVEFTGTDSSNPETEFHIEKSTEKKADALTYRSGDGNYYLKVKKSGEANLRKLVHFPTDDKYFFHIKSVGCEYDASHTIQSLKTKEFLHCGDDGKAFMKEVKSLVNGVPEDRETWFSCIRPSSQRQGRVQGQSAEMLFAQIGMFETGTECLKAATVEKCFDAEDSGKKNSECTSSKQENSKDTQKGNSKDLEGGSPEDPVNEKCDDPEMGDSKDSEREETPAEEQDEEQNGESKNRNLEDLAKENPNDMGGKISDEKRISE